MDLSQNIIAKLELQDWPEDKRAAFVASMTTLVEKRVMLRLMETMSEEDLVQAEELSGDPDKLLVFLGEKYPDIGALFDEEIAKLSDELVDASGIQDA